MNDCASKTQGWDANRQDKAKKYMPNTETVHDLENKISEGHEVKYFVRRQSYSHEENTGHLSICVRPTSTHAYTTHTLFLCACDRRNFEPASRCNGVVKCYIWDAMKSRLTKISHCDTAYFCDILVENIIFLLQNSSTKIGPFSNRVLAM